MLAALAVLSLLYLWFHFSSDRPWDKDSLVRSMYIQRVFSHPEFLVDPWARPLGVLPYLPTAFLPAGVREGFEANRFLSLVYSLLACLFAGLAAARLGMKRPWIAALALGFQPLLLQNSAGVTPETVFVTLFALGLWLHALGMIRAEVLCFALLPLARFENVVLFLPLAWYLVHRARRPGLLLLLAAPTLVWYLLLAWIRSDLLWIVTYGREMASWNPSGLDRSLHWARGNLVDPLHYFYIAPAIFGVPLVFLALVGLVRKWNLFTVFFLVMVGIHCLLKGRAGHAGYPRYILPVAPLLALFAAWGLEFLESGLEETHARLLRWGSVLSLAAACLILAPPLKRPQPETRIRKEAVAWFSARHGGEPYTTSQPWIDFFLDRNWCDHPRLTRSYLERAPRGLWVFWDWTSPREDHQVRLSDLERNPSFREEARFPPGKAGEGEYQVVLFKKVGSGKKK